MEVKIGLDAAALGIIKKLNSAGYEAYVVGGYVRNGVLGLPAYDCDITTSATPDRVLEIFSDTTTFAPGLKHGTVCVKIGGRVFEITSFRTEKEYVGHRAPSAVEFTASLGEDVRRRDFTVNALCCDGEKVIDLVGGLEDCQNGIIRAIGDPNERFEEDALRILRAVRFCSTLGFTMEERTKSAVFARKRLLNEISAERIREEFDKILLGKNAVNALLEYRDIIAVFIPEIVPCFDFDQHSRFHRYDVYGHMVRAVGGSKPDLTLRLAAFLHDIGKPPCFFADENGEGHFYGHAKKSAYIAQKVLDRLKYPNAVKREVISLVELHDYPLVPKDRHEEAERYLKKDLAKFGEHMVRAIMDIKRADNSAKTDALLVRLAEMDELERKLDAILSEKPCLDLKSLNIKGGDVVALGAKGPEISATLNALLDAVISGEIENERDALLSAADKILLNLRK